WTCPELEPYSAIYFYQFSACGADSKTWTTRFTITSPSGEKTDPENATQDNGDAIPWGTGKLVDESAAVAAPSCDGNAGNATASASGGASASASATGASSSAAGAASESAGASSASEEAATNTALSNNAASGSGSPSGTAGAAEASQSNDALTVQARAWQAAGALGASALAFTFVL
ncbi:hypothetical protein HDZ31DRAFT_68819, partial [Schizophyllum fasciatum]